MTSYFFDSSALAKAFRHKKGSDRVLEIWNDTTASLSISILTIVEFHSVFAQKVRTNEITADDFRAVTRKFNGAIKSHKLRVIALTGQHYRKARALIATYGTDRRLRIRFAATCGGARRHRTVWGNVICRGRRTSG